MENVLKKNEVEEMKAWLKGGLIGLGIVIVSYIFTQIWCRVNPSEFCGLLWFYIPYYIMQFTGIDYIVPLFVKNIFGYSFLVFSFLLLFGIGVFIGFWFSRETSLKKKLIVAIVIVLLIAPLSIYSHHLKYNDEKIMLEYRIGSYGWFIADYSICEELSIFTADYLKEECFSSFLMPKGKAEALNAFVKTPEMQECLKIDSKWVCIQRVAVELDNMSLCDHHPLPDAKKSCVQQIGIQHGNISLCMRPEESYSESSDSWKWYTYADCIIAIAKKTNDIALCENINNTYYRYDDCKLRLMIYSLEFCNNLHNHDSYDIRFKDDCITKVAFNQANLTICELAEHPQKREECIEKIAMKTRNLELCKTFEIIQPDQCIETIAYLQEDKTICNELSADWAVDRCVDDVENLIDGKLNLDSIEEYR